MGEVESLEAHYSDLRQKLNTGALAPDAFRREVAKLWFEDADGHTWMLGAQTGHWYVYRNDQWEPANPPRDASVHTINCPRCEEPVETGSAFCGHCGLRLSDSPPESQLEPEVTVASLKPAAAGVQPALRRLSPRVAIAGAGAAFLVLVLVIGGVAFTAMQVSGLFAAAQASPQPTVRATKTPTSPGSDSQGVVPTPILVALVTATPSATPAPNRSPTAVVTPGATATNPPTETPAPTSTPPPPPTAGPSSTPPPPTNTPPPPPPTATPTSAAVVRGRIAFAMLSASGSSYEVYVSGADGSGRQLVAPNSRQPQFSPNGAKLVLTGMGDFRAKLFARSLGGGETGLDNTPIEARDGSWSPDGKSVIFASNEMEDRLWRLYVVDASNTLDQRTTVRFGKIDLFGRYPTWLAGGQILYSGCDVWAGGSQCGLVRINSDGSAPTLLTNQRLDTAPVAAAGSVAFMSARDGNWEIYSVPLAGGPARNLSNSPSQDGLPAFSPDGQLIAFVSDRGGQWAVWVMRADGSAQRKLFPLENGYANGGDLDWTTERISWAP